jgi:predicted DNA-binding transcriptional regulator AlpA
MIESVKDTQEQNVKVLGQFLTEQEVSAITGISVKTLQKWRLFGRGPKYLKVGGRAVRYAISDLEDWLAACPVGGGGTAA